MSTNFYAYTPFGDMIHLGKRSVGWRFTFKSREGVTNLSELITWLETTPCQIKSEYGDELDPVEFVSMAKEWGQDGGHQNLDCWCGNREDVHGPSYSIPFGGGHSVDDETGTDWLEAEFS